MSSRQMVKLLVRAENLVVLIALSGLVLAVVWGVLSRYIAAYPATWTGEISGFLFTWVVFIGGMAAYRRGQHIRITFFLDMLPPSLAGYVRRLADLAMLSFLAYATILSFEMTIQGASRPSVALRLPYALVYMSTLISFGVMFITALLRFVGAIPEPQPLSSEETP